MDLVVDGGKMGSFPLALLSRRSALRSSEGDFSGLRAPPSSREKSAVALD